ncbi:hypothetical protein PLICRDRAFT_464536 [Plicaturopsis crispa FD-325 SS-3]|nr:hypothetical protein PLICRDRAFT_464536 [Plicaturopsis crispa FD-325 SS-3]
MPAFVVALRPVSVCIPLPASSASCARCPRRPSRFLRTKRERPSPCVLGLSAFYPHLARLSFLLQGTHFTTDLYFTGVGCGRRLFVVLSSFCAFQTFLIIEHVTTYVTVVLCWRNGAYDGLGAAVCNATFV